MRRGRRDRRLWRMMCLVMLTNVSGMAETDVERGLVSHSEFETLE